MQGLGALEFVLFGTGAEALAAAGDPYRCPYGAAIAGNVATIAGDVDAAWAGDDGFAGQWAHPGPGNPLYQTGTEAVTELLEVFVNGLELVRDVRLGGFLGEQAAGRQAEAGDLLALGRHGALACRQHGRHEGAVRGIGPRRRAFAGHALDRRVHRVRVRQCDRRGQRCRRTRSPKRWPTRRSALSSPTSTW